MQISIDSLKEFYGCCTDSDLAEAISVSRIAIFKWKKYGIPYSRQAQIQIESNGILTAEPKPIATAS